MNYEIDKVFSGTQVGALIESFRNDIRVLAEGQGAICQRLDAVEQKVDKIDVRLTPIDDAIRIFLPSLNARVKTLEDNRKS